MFSFQNPVFNLNIEFLTSNLHVKTIKARRDISGFCFYHWVSSHTDGIALRCFCSADSDERILKDHAVGWLNCKPLTCQFKEIRAGFPCVTSSMVTITSIKPMSPVVSRASTSSRWLLEATAMGTAPCKACRNVDAFAIGTLPERNRAEYSTSRTSFTSSVLLPVCRAIFCAASVDVMPRNSSTNSRWSQVMLEEHFLDHCHPNGLGIN